MWFVDCDNKQRQLDFSLFPAAEWHSLTRTLILIQFNRIMRFYRVNNEITRINILLSSSAWAWCLILVTLPAKSVFVHGFCCLLSSPFWVVLLFSTFNSASSGNIINFSIHESRSLHPIFLSVFQRIFSIYRWFSEIFLFLYWRCFKIVSCVKINK